MKTKATHTPGPWKVDESGDFVETEYPVNFKGNYIHICDFRRPEDRANAALIAAAPTMLAALEAIAGWASDTGPLKHKTPMGISEYARAAAAKARGE